MTSKDYASSAAGWHGSIARFLDAEDAEILDGLRGICGRLSLPVSHSQEMAWRDALKALRRELRQLTLARDAASEWGLVLEYELARERGRRPDAVILTHERVLVLEFKQQGEPWIGDIDQVTAYSRDLSEYHEACHGKPRTPILVLTASKAEGKHLGVAWVVGSTHLSDLLNDLVQPGEESPPDLEAWLSADYTPLPSLVAAARAIFQHEPLPRIRRAESAGIPQTLQVLTKAAETARERKERHVAFVTGVPGAGKTLVGLQFVYNTRFSDRAENRPAVLLSGNGPLVKVLKHALRSGIFVQDVHAFLLRYGGGSMRVPEEHIWVYDEAQRAWDAERSAEKRSHELSEHEDFIRLGERVPSWALLVGLIGDGQEIHLGEEGGLALWRDAVINSSEEWIIHCPRRISGSFAGCRLEIDDALDLTVSLRSHLASELHAWVAELLAGDIVSCSGRAGTLRDAGFEIYVTRELEDAKAYVRERYAGAFDKRYGLIASSKAQILDRFGMDSGFQASRRVKEGPWFNDPPDSPYSCCALTTVATEFMCQGLELDFPIVGWGTDLYWNENGWHRRLSSRREKAKDPMRLRLNSYRVLLTRGRDGMAIFVPPVGLLDETYETLIGAGCDELTAPAFLS